ncbi:NUDIX hydrolase [Uliginosibacterium sp. sgz301328]|uniref:NUDIX hydrolase n=1 Tax=Uliginosibacterium sp. sgz301328 TaxID=3243764 RepID=UPI00359DD7F0
MAWKPDVTVAALVERDGYYLLVEEHTDQGLRLNQPAGHLEEDESLINACIREAMEETAHHVVPDYLVGVYQWKRPAGDITYLRFAYAARATGKEEGRALDEGIVRTVWMTLAELEASPERLRSPLVLQCIRDHAAGRRFPLELVRHFDN